MITIEELVKKAKNNNINAYFELILFIQDTLYKIAKSRLQNEEEIKDVIQNTIINAYINLGKLKHPKFFKYWIIKILINECNLIYRHNKAEINLIQKYSHTISNEEYIEEIPEFDNLIQVLNEKEKKIFSLHFEYDLSIKQIADLLTMNESTIKSILHRGKIKIKRTYKPWSIFILILCFLITYYLKI